MEFGFHIDGLDAQEGIHMHIKMDGIEFPEDGLVTEDQESGCNHTGKEGHIVDIEGKIRVKDKISVYNNIYNQINLSGRQQNKTA